ncbi:Acg family FMN-binding oxidoreductase [Nocardia jiangsuensis]|uniref:Acg family FMN-binding oxidoreductase n=1 Tax=Nocardia jiangsuensis TaxID=1691563 RepID=A0ABV8DP11_9NOCA
MTDSVPDEPTLRGVLERAGRAPSLHNSQPWQWRWNGARLALYTDPERLLPGTDAFNRQGMLGCGAVLHHAMVAFAAAGWPVRAALFPDPVHRAHLASLTFAGPHPPAEGELALGAAIEARYTDRAPMAAVPNWSDLVQVLAAVCERHDVLPQPVAPELRAELERISWTAGALRRRDPRYQDEARWWLGGAAPGSGVPAAVLPNRDDALRVPVRREFPAGSADPGPTEHDDAHLLLLATADDSPESLLSCGAVLSAVLLECADHAVSTCVLTHLTELPAIRSRVVELTGAGHPQAFVRAGLATAPRPPRTPRRPIGTVLTPG